MRPARLVTRGLLFHARLHAATLAGVVTASAILSGALALGDSVRASLARAARLRVGVVDAAIGNGERFFASALAARLGQRLALATAPAAVIQLPAVVATGDGGRRLPDAQLLGVGAEFFALAPHPPQGLPVDDQAWLGPELARALAVGPGDELVLRVPRPSATTRELALTPIEDAIQPLRVRVTRVLRADEFGVFALRAGAGPSADLFVAREWLARGLDVPGRANRILAASEGRAGELVTALRASFELSDVGLSWRTPAEGIAELVSDQVFLADKVVAALRALEPAPLGLLTYFVNSIEKGGRATPYSTVASFAALDARPAGDLGGWRVGLGGELRADEIALNDWTARDLGAAPGDTIRLRYFVLGSGRALEECTHDFRLARVLPTVGLGADPTLAPDFPGIGSAENCRDWDPGIPMDLGAIRDQDEAYWDAHRGAPKGFVAPESARALWGNRYGALTAVRIPAEGVSAAEARLRALAPGDLGLSVLAVSASSNGTSDFGGLFLGLSFFLIGSALVLTGLFFAFSVERRAAELGTLLVCGFGRGEVARLALAEAGLLCALGAGLGVPLGLAYTRVLLAGLERVWQDAVGRTELVFAVSGSSLALSFVLALALALVAVALVLRRALRARPLALLWGELAPEAPRAGRARLRRGLLALFTLGALAAVLGARSSQGGAAGGLAFGAGFAALLAGLLAVPEALQRTGRARSLATLGLSNAARRPGRSLTTVTLMASSVFLLVVAGASRQGPAPRVSERVSGTGGFDYLGRTGLPVLHDLRTPEGREEYGLTAEDLTGVEIVPLRVHDGDEASCLNLDQPRNPRLLGVPPGALRERFAFAASVRAVDDPWSLLEQDLGEGIVPAVVDAVSLQWTLKKALGDELELTDGRGRPFRARVVATLSDSILQGDVVLAARDFEARFPDDVGQRAFLIAAPAERAAGLATRLVRALGDEGLSLVPTHERLDLLHSVQNTYLSIFQALGGLGLALGSVGLLALVLRSAVERRGELALLSAVGYTRRELRILMLCEQGGLVWGGLGLGALAGALVILARLQPGTLAAVGPLAALLVAVGLGGCVWVWLGSAPALRGSVRRALERE